MQEMKKLTSDNNKFTQEYQLDRLLNNDFVNPYDILELTQDATDVEIKKKFKMLSILIHPDKCKHERASDAFHIVEQANKTLMDVDKRRMYQRVMREARDRVEVARRKENIRRAAKGLEELTKDTLNIEITEMCQSLFTEIQEKRDQLVRMDNAYKRKRGQELQKEATKEEVEKEDLKAWEEGRERRVDAWRDFSHKKQRTEKKLKTKFGIHAPQ